LRRCNPEIIQIHLSRDLLLVEAACSLAGLRPALILHKHIASAGNKKDSLHRMLYGRLDTVIAVSDFVKKSLLASCPVEPAKVRVLHFGLDPERFAAPGSLDPSERARVRCELGAESDDNVLAAVIGRLERRKGQDTFLRAATLALEQEPRLRFALAGQAEGDWGRELEALTRSLGLEERVTLAGHRSDMRAVLAALDILVVPSLEEAFGLSAVEGMLAGLPVVAARAGALPEFVIEGRSGALVPPADPPALAGALTRLAADPDSRRALGSRARAWALENLSLEKHLSALDRLYAECLGCHPRT
ncbi:glycosyltransferase family 4 protein, partial [bacterium]|nr:glycosyltransferase family 4 protein [bacterium]